MTCCSCCVELNSVFSDLWFCPNCADFFGDSLAIRKGLDSAELLVPDFNRSETRVTNVPTELNLASISSKGIDNQLILING